jgi:hypothetical protein
MDIEEAPVQYKTPFTPNWTTREFEIEFTQIFPFTLQDLADRTKNILISKKCCKCEYKAESVTENSKDFYCLSHIEESDDSVIEVEYYPQMIEHELMQAIDQIEQLQILLEYNKSYEGELVLKDPKTIEQAKIRLQIEIDKLQKIVFEDKEVRDINPLL